MSFTCGETVYKFLTDILACILVPFSKTEMKRKCANLLETSHHT